jgi:hypothetical protein
MSRWTRTVVDAGGKTSTHIMRYDLKRSGPLRTLRVVSPDREVVYLANPERSFRAERKAAGDAWQIRDDPQSSRARSYRWTLRETDRMAPVAHVSVPLLEMADSARTLVDPLSLRVTRLERIRTGGRPLIAFEFEGRQPQHPFFRKLAVQLSADDYSLVHKESVDPTGNHSRGDAVHDRHDGVPLLKSIRSGTRRDDGSQVELVLTVDDRSFEPIPAAEFTPERVLGGAPVQHIAANQRSTETPVFFRWYPLPLAVGVVSMLTGAGLLTWSRR